MKVIGLMTTWNNLEYFKRSVHQALSFCDELILVEGCHSKKYPKHSTDGTCEYVESIKGIPGLTIMDFKFSARYDKVQRRIRQEFPKQSVFYKPGNWVFQWDDDCFFMEEDLPKLRTAIESTGLDAVGYDCRHFIYNFKFNSIGRGFVDVYKIVNGIWLSGVSNVRYKDGKRLKYQHINGVTLFHYNYVKSPQRFKARMVMSVEKGTQESTTTYEEWMNVKWDKEEDIFKSKDFIERIRPGDGLNIYNGEHPEVVSDHPWRNIKDVRSIN